MKQFILSSFVSVFFLCVSQSAESASYVEPSTSGLKIESQEEYNRVQEQFFSLDRVGEEYKNIHVRMYPLKNVLPGDFYPMSEEGYYAVIYNSDSFELISQESEQVLAVSKRLAMNYAKKVFVINGRSIPFEKATIRPKNSEVTTSLFWNLRNSAKKPNLSWGSYYKNAKLYVELRGHFEFKPTVYTRANEGESIKKIVKKDRGTPHIVTTLNELAVTQSKSGVNGLLGLFESFFNGAAKKAKKNAGIVLPQAIADEDIDLAVVRSANDVHWSLINILPIEDYLYSVVPSEVPVSAFHEEAVRAQAIAARTYALWEMMFAREVLRSNFDVDPTVWYQQYRGADREYIKSNEAVDATRSQIATFDDRVIIAYFSANSGGKTCRASECLQHYDEPYLLSFDDDPGVLKRPKGMWSYRIKLESLKEVLDELEMDYDSQSLITQMEAIELGESGRVWGLNLDFDNGDKIRLDRKGVRKLLRTTRMENFLFELEPSVNATQKVNGRGWGHGVGLCQHGADVLAKKGYAYQEIIKFYYKGVEINTL